MQATELNISLLHPVVHEGVRWSVRFWRYRSLSSEDVELGQGFYWPLADLTQAWYVSLVNIHCLGLREESSRGLICKPVVLDIDMNDEFK